LLIQEVRHESGPKELRVKIGVEYHLKLHALKLLRGKRMSEAVEEALEFYFERVRAEHEAQQGTGAASFDLQALVGTMDEV
jgi:hypothetical protein